MEIIQNNNIIIISSQNSETDSQKSQTQQTKSETQIQQQNLDILNSQKPTPQNIIDNDKDNKNDNKLPNNLQELRKSELINRKIQTTKKLALISLWVKIVVSLILLVTGACLFLFSIKKSCPIEEYPNKQDCVDLLAQEISKWLKIYPLIVLCIVPVTILGYYKLIDRFRIICLISIIEQIILCFCLYSLDMSSADERDYSSTQAIVLIVSLTLAYFVFFALRFYYFLYMRFFNTCIFITLTILGLSIWLIVEMVYSCDNWRLGINGEISNDEQYSIVYTPTVCWPDILGDFLDLSPGSCNIKDFKKYQTEVLYQYDVLSEQYYKDQKKYQKEINNIIEQSKYLAWPKTNNFTDIQRYPDNIQDSLILNTKIVENMEETFKQNESEVIIDIENLNVNINIQKNEELINQRKSQYEQVDSLADTVIVIYIDTLSRVQMHRKMKKTINFLKSISQNVDNNNNSINDQQSNQQQQQQSFEFYRYHSLDKQTLNNNMVLHYDIKYPQVYDNLEIMEDNYEKNNDENKIHNLMSTFKQQGHIVGHSSNTCTSQCSFRNEHSEIRKFFNEEPADHEFLFYDPMYVNRDNYFDVTKGPNSFKRRCSYQQDTAQTLFEYGTKFLDAYKDEKKVLYLEFTDAHEITSEVAKYMDEYMYQFLYNAQKNGHLDKKSMVYIFADHGQHMLPSFYMTDKNVEGNMWDQKDVYTRDVYATERMLPLFQLIVSKDILQQQELQQIIDYNQQVTIGIQDIRNSLIASIGDKQKIKQSLNIFQELKPERDCRDIHLMSFLHQSQYCVSRPRDL